MRHTTAITVLTNAAEACENNAPINEAAGNQEQADLERQNATDFRAAIAALEAIE